VYSSEFENNYFTEMCGSEAGSNLRLIDFVYHSTLGLRKIKKKKKGGVTVPDGDAIGEPEGPTALPLPSECGTHRTVKARFWPWLSGKSLQGESGLTVPDSDAVREPEGPVQHPRECQPRVDRRRVLGPVQELGLRANMAHVRQSRPDSVRQSRPDSV